MFWFSFSLFRFSEFIQILCERLVENIHSMCTDWPIRYCHSNPKEQWQRCQSGIFIVATEVSNVIALHATVSDSIWKSIEKTTSATAMGQEVCSLIHSVACVRVEMIFHSFICSKLDIHAMKYCIAINMNRSRNSLCDALDSIVDGPASGRHFCSQLKTSDRTIRIGNPIGNATIFEISQLFCYFRCDL